MEDKKIKKTPNKSTKKTNTKKSSTTKKSTVKKSNTTKKVTTKKSTTTKNVTNKTKVNNVKKKEPEIKESIIKEESIINEIKEIDIPKEEKVIEIPKKIKIEKKYIIFSIISSLIMVIGIVSFFLVINPKMKEKIELREFKNTINSLLKEENLSKVQDEIKNDIMSGDRKKLEDKVEDYLLKNLEIKDNINKLINDERITNSLDLKNVGQYKIIENYNSTISNLDKEKEELNKIRETAKNNKLEDEELNEVYDELIDKIDSNIILDEVESVKEYINKSKPVLEYLKNNKSFYKIDNKLIFLKRSKKDEYDKLIEKNKCDKCNYLKSYLVEDKEGPVISANNITITKGDKLNLNSKVSCNDKVDDKTDCVISGTFNSNKAGTYKITIKSTDKSNNTSTKIINVIVKEKAVVKKTTTSSGSNKRVNTNNKPYYIEVIRNQNVVIVYGLDSNKKEYNRIVKVFVVSVGRNGKTPTGTFKTTRGVPWGALIGGVWGQYSTRITGSYLFHSVPYYSKNKGDLEWQEYNKLGTAASAGCVRMTVRDVKWIYDNISNGTTVRIYDGSLPKGVSKPSAPKIPSNSKNKGWDPTDPDPKNPWHKK